MIKLHRLQVEDKLIQIVTHIVVQLLKKKLKYWLQLRVNTHSISVPNFRIRSGFGSYLSDNSAYET